MDSTNRHSEAARASKWSAIFTLLGFLIVATAIAYGTIEINKLEKKKELLQKEISTYEDKLVSVKTQLDNANSKLENVYNQMAFVGAQLAQKQTDLASNLAERALSDSEDPAINARIFIHIQDEIIRDKAERIKKDLENRSYIVASTIKAVKISLSHSQLRFFRKREESEAASIANYLNGLNLEGLDVRLNDLSEYYENSKKIPPRYYELWLKK